MLDVFDRSHVAHALIGDLAFGLHARVRSSRGAKFIVDCADFEFTNLLDRLQSDGFQLHIRDALQKWSVHRSLSFSRGPVRFDWYQPITPIHRFVLKSAVNWPWLDRQVRVATAEGLVLTKLAAFRPQDQIDIETLLIANREDIDLAIIRDEWATFAKTEAERTAWLEAAIAKHVTPYRV